MKYILNFIMVFLLFVSCRSEQEAHIKFNNNNIVFKPTIVDSIPVAKINLNVMKSDLIYTNKTDSLFIVKVGKGGDANGIVYVLKHENYYKVIYNRLYSYIFTEIFVYDIDKTQPVEVIILWQEEDTYIIEIDKINLSKGIAIENIFQSKVYGIPWIDQGHIYYVKDNSVYFHYLINDGTAHEKAQLKYDNEGKIFLEPSNRIPFKIGN